MNQELKQLITRLTEELSEAIEPSLLFEKTGVKEFAGFVSATRELEKEGEIIITKKGKIVSSKNLGLIPATIISQSEGFAFAHPTHGGEDIFIFTEDLKGAMFNDTVLIGKIKESSKGLSGKVEKVLSQGTRKITGTIIRRKSGYELIPDVAIRYNVPIEYGKHLKAREGDKVQVTLVNKPKKRLIFADVIKIYGKSKSAKICADAIIDASGIPTKFPKEVINQAKMLSQRGVTSSDLVGRLDLRKELIFTIDGADAKDLDDAISVKKTKKGWKLGVHIADVSNYVKANSVLDEEAKQRGTSVYFADRVIPMLPTELSNGICSLNAGEDKLTFSAMLDIDEKGNLISYEFRKSVINSKVRGVYSEINDILSERAEQRILDKYQVVMDSIWEAKRLATVLEKNAKKRGNMDLNSSESRFELNKNGVCINVFPRVQGESEKIIEHFMIEANQAAALYAKSAQIPFVYRVHESPDPERIRILYELVGALGLKNRRIKDGLRTTDISALLDEAEGTPGERIVSHQVLRTMAKARYDSHALGHFGLALEDYCHFTSPIRRYPDTAIHRILTDLVSGERIDKIEKRYSGFVNEASKLSSNYEIRAMRAEREAEKCYMAEYATQHIGQEYDGIISGATTRGVFVELENSMEGFVSLEYFPECDFIFDGLTTHTDKRTNRKLVIGNSLRIRIIAADVATGMIDFAPAEE